ncbi:1-phosphatidylinositol phosphodiesterase precursor [Massarina eburnea CBS 473.64]|uniref:1-phosphatidylinositol phosphodiesterase n=1 Tax=Massarina eburnea CBS 473.64 TaxID=1395130 RepID=A0A6A6RYM6_9PLEO|nr:1-phosphatidylinositol phosphodiesterase precursor [Massarina eburnea CBS 473.64]
MAPPLTIRNLTSLTILLKRLETFEDPNTKQSKATGFPSNSKDTTSLAPTALKLGEHAQTFSHEELHIELAPFESFSLKTPRLATPPDKKTPQLSTATLRITIETSSGERYRIDTNPSYTQKASKSFTPLTPHPSTSYTALYHPARPSAHLTIHNNHLPDYSRWMDSLPSALPVSAISIPGTHNAHTHYRGLPSVRCQVNTIKTQLENGIRFLDVRVQPASASDTSKKDLYLVHGAFPISLSGTKYFAPLLQILYTFLDEHPSETILLSLKREGVGSATDDHLAAILTQHYIAPDAEKWYTDPRLPYLGAVRGKIVLVRRYELGAPSTSCSTSTASSSSPLESEPPSHGLDASDWPHNSTHAIHGPFCVQDWCEVLHPSSIPSKLQYANEHLERAAACTAFVPGFNTDRQHPVPPAPLHLNFLSGSNFWNKGTWPEKISKVVNRGIEEWVCIGHYLEVPVSNPREPGWTSIDIGRSDDEDGGRDEGFAGERGRNGNGVVRKKAESGDGGTGVVIMDNVGQDGDWDLVRLVVGMNMGVLLKMGECEINGGRSKNRNSKSSSD